MHEYIYIYILIPEYISNLDCRTIDLYQICSERLYHGLENLPSQPHLSLSGVFAKKIKFRIIRNILFN